MTRRGVFLSNRKNELNKFVAHTFGFCALYGSLFELPDQRKIEKEKSNPASRGTA